MPSWIIWLAAIIVFSVAEGLTYQLVGIWFAIGALTAMIVSFFSESIILQSVIFLAISVICLVFTRPVFKKMLGTRIVKTNSDALIGQNAVVTETIDNINSCGQAKIGGNMWTARSADDTIIESGSVVAVEKIEGAKLIVKKREENN